MTIEKVAKALHGGSAVPSAVLVQSMLYLMKGATEELFVKVTYYKKREGLGRPQWHFTMHIPQC